MKYMLMIYGDERGLEQLSADEMQQIVAEYRQFTQEIRSGGQYVGGGRLQPTTAATSVRVRDGKRLITDGPFAETREQLAGYYVIDVKDLDEAILVAARVPSVRMGTIEVRPLVETPTVSPV